MCMLKKVMIARGDCDTGTQCTTACKDALGKVLVTLDGSCCTQLEVAKQDHCKELMKTSVVPMLRAKITEKCGPMVNIDDDFEFLFDGLSEFGVFSKVADNR